MNVPRTISLATALFLLGIGLAASQTRAQNRSTVEDTSRAAGPIIDMHLHAHSPERFPSAEPLTGIKTPETTAEVRNRTIQRLRQHGVVQAFTSGRHVDRYQEAAPRRIVEGCGASADPTEQQLDSLRALITERDCEFIGELGYQYAGIPPDDPSIEPVFALAESLDVPLGIHVGLGPPGVAYEKSDLPFTAPEYRMKHSNPLLLEDVLVEHPDLRLYVMHAGWPMLDELIGLLYAHSQVYVDVAVINWVLPRAEFHRYLRRIVEAGFGDRVMYGSDQMVWPQSIGKSIEAIRSVPFLSEEQKRDILYNNAARFLGLSDETIARHHEMAAQ